MKKGALSKPVPINTRESVSGAENGILTGTGRRHYVPDFEGCLSVKTIVAGSAVWEAGGRRFVVHENSYLVLNDRQHYRMVIDSARRVTTFCLFFQRGFVEDVFRGLTTPAAELLDSPRPPAPLPLGFVEKLETQESRVLGLVREMRGRVLGGVTSKQELERDFYAVAEQLVVERQQADALVAKLPALRAATRQELYRRLLRGRDFILSTLDRPVLLADVAREACLSPYHFHRTFTRAFRETPHAYLTRQRLEKARLMLGQGGRSVTEVCFECGFESPTSFSQLFRRRFGASPREFLGARARK